MSTIVEGRIPVDRFALGDTFEAVPTAEFEIMPLIAEQDAGTSLLWAAASGLEPLTAALRQDDTTDDIQIVSAPDGARLYRVEWAPAVRRALSSLAETNGTVLQATGRAAGWELCFLFPERSAVSSMHDVCMDHRLDISMESIRSLSDERPGSGLTEKQHETLRAAYESGYYTIPRETTLQELSRSQGISHQALSERLRRGHKALVRRTVVTTGSAVRTELLPNETPVKLGI